MTDYYEKPQWTSSAKSYASSTSLFCTLATILGFLGIIVAVILFFIGLLTLDDGGFLVLISSIATAFQSLMLIAFSTMMRHHSEVLLAIFEMSLTETRHYLRDDKSS